MNRLYRTFSNLAVLLLAACFLAGAVVAEDLQVGSRGVKVKQAQEKLAELGYDLGLVDGVYGGKTRGAVRLFQSDRGLSVTGVIDDRTFDMLMAAKRPSYKPVDTDAPADGDSEVDDGAADDESFDSDWGSDVDWGDFGDMEDESMFSLGGHLKTANAVRFSKGDKRFPMFAQIGNLLYVDSVEGTGALSLQQNKLHMFLKGDYSSSVSSYAAFDVYATSKPDRPFAEKVEFEIDELYVDFLWDRVGLRIGKEKIVWGLMDVISPFNLLNSGDLVDPFVNGGLEDARGQWAVHFNYDNVGKLRLEAVLVPIWNRSIMPTADLNDKTGEMEADYWFPPIFSSIPRLLWVPIQDDQGNLSEFIIENDFEGSEKPKKDLSSTAFGSRLTATLGSFDVGAYFITTLDPKPNPMVKTTVIQGDVDFGGDIGVRNVGLGLLNEVEQKFTRVWTWGGSAETVVGRFRFKGETALTYGRKFFPDLTTEQGLMRLYNTAAANVNVYQAGREEGKKYMAWDVQMGSEYTIPGADIMTSFQIGLTQRFGHEEGFFGSAGSFDLTLYLQKSFADDQFTSSLATLMETESGTFYLSPRFRYIPQYLDFFEFGFGANLFVGPGPDDWGGAFKTHKSVLSSYRKYSHVFGIAKLSFDIM